MQKSETLQDLAGAFAKAQGEFQAIQRTRTARVRTRTGGEYSYQYADLADVIEATRGALAKNGLSIVQDVARGDNALTVTTMLLHSSGQFLSSELTVPLGEFGNNAVQALGGTITYARRYALSAVLNVASEDDDGNAADQAPPAPKAPEQAKKTTQATPAPKGYGKQREEALKALEGIVGAKGSPGAWSDQDRAPLNIVETIKKADQTKDIKVLEELLAAARSLQAARKGAASE
jgi:hypothetical protein